MLKYKPAKFTTAQALLVAMGLDDLRLDAHHGGQRESFTKTGPGRKHAQGGPGEKNAPLRIRGNAGPGFVVHTNTKRAWRRASIKACGGIRQFKRAARFDRSLGI